MNLPPPANPGTPGQSTPGQGAPGPSTPGQGAARSWSPPGAASPGAAAPQATAAAAAAPPATVRSVLFATPDPQVPLLASGSDGDPLERLPPPLRSAARKEANRAVLSALDIAVPDIIIRGWLRHRALKAAAERTKDGGRELVDLADHTIASVHRPKITITIDGAPITVVALTVEVSLKLVGITAVVEQASLVGLEAGAVAATVKLKVGTDVVASRSQRLEAHHAITVDRPRPLLAPAEPTRPPLNQRPSP